MEIFRRSNDGRWRQLNEINRLVEAVWRTCVEADCVLVSTSVTQDLVKAEVSQEEITYSIMHKPDE